MPVYAYRGLDAKGREKKGLLDADSPRTLRAQLKKQGIRIVEHREETAKTKSRSQASKSGGGSSFTLSGLAETEVDLGGLFDRVDTADIALVTRQLATLLASGITLIDALGAIVDQVEGEKMKRVFGNVKTDVNEGSSLADAMAKHDAIFDQLYVSMVRAGEASGALDKVLARLADFTEAQARLKSKILSAMLYPAIMVGVGSVIMLVLFIVVIPRFPALFLFVFAFFRWKKSKRGRPVWDRFTLRAPLFGFIVRLVAIARFSRTLATLLRAGVPVLTALDITKDVLNNVRLADVVAEARDAIREGESIAQPLRRSGEFPPIVVHMVATGEASGQLEQMLEHVADNYDFQVDQRVEKLTTLIEPIMIVGMGGAVAFVVFSILMPILQLSQHVR
jgi:general secretion pathway protein F